MKRRLAAILAADVAGYSRLMGADETGTLRRMTSLRTELLDPLIAEHDGRVVKVMGDGLLVEFPSVVSAVGCAVAWQHRVTADQAGHPADQWLQFRIGVNLGDIIVDDGDIHGDGVNIAARLESLAQPGGICLSADAYRQARGKVEAHFEDLGEQSLKNVSEPVHVFRVMPADGGPAAPSPVPSEPPLPDKPSIAVLPFTNMSGDPEQEYLSDGITEDIITELSRFAGLFVIARNSSFVYKGRAVDVVRVARELGVRYLLEGSVRRSGNRLRITGQLLHRDGGGHVWGEKYDRELEDIFELQDEITRNVVGSIAPQIELAELERGHRLIEENLTAYELALKAQALFHDGVRKLDAELFERAESLIVEALALDPRNIHALWTKCLVHMYRHVFRWTDAPETALAVCEDTTELLLHTDSTNAKAYQIRAWAKLYRRKFDAAIADHQRALDLNPNLASNLFAMSWSEAVAGHVEAAREHAELALRLSPRETDIWIGEGYSALALACFYERNFEETLRWGHLADQMQPAIQSIQLAACGHLGDFEAARGHARALASFAPEYLAGLLTGEIEICKLPEHNALILEGLRKAQPHLSD